MSWLEKTLSIFGWKKNQESSSKTTSPVIEKNNQIETIKDLKDWFEKELPPLAWQRVNLRVAKYAIQNFNITLNKANDSLVLPKELLKKINESVKELFNKEMPYGN